MTIALSKYRLAYTPIPKVACTSIKRTFYQLKYGEPPNRKHLRLWLKGGRVHGVFPSKPFDPSYFARLEGYWKFAVVRDPAARILSVYSNKVTAKQGFELVDRPKVQNLRSMGIRMRAWLYQIRYGSDVRCELSLQPTLDEFVLKLDAYRASFQVIQSHTNPASYYLGNDLSVYDAIFRISEIGALEQELSARVGRPVRIPHVNLSTGRKLTVNDLSKEAFDALMDRLAPEYELLADYFPRPSQSETA